MDRIYDVGIIGGGISGVVTAMQFADSGIDTILFEQKDSLVSGPPFCHLHAGGNLYPEISLKECKMLMKQSVEMARLFPQSIDARPTFISIPKTENYTTEKIEGRLKILLEYYKELVANDSNNEVLGKPDKYYKVYSEENLEILLQKPSVVNPTTPDDWMCNTLKCIDYKKLKTPVFMVQEFGWNLFRLAAQAQLALSKAEKCCLKTNTLVREITDVREQSLTYNWEVLTHNSLYKVKYLVNSSGFKTSIIDDRLQIKAERLIEFKAAYIAKWEALPSIIPELIFHGKRGTENGMAQLTPYRNGYYQIHGMTNNITLFKGGLVKANANEPQANFDENIKQKLEKGWDREETKLRTERAIDFVSRFVPQFNTASPAGPPLYGAQQILGNDLKLRVAEVSFPSKFYARSEIIKASSALSVAHKIGAQIHKEGIVDYIPNNTCRNLLIDSIPKKAIDKMADEIVVQRGFPASLSKLLIKRD